MLNSDQLEIKHDEGPLGFRVHTFRCMLLHVTPYLGRRQACQYLAEQLLRALQGGGKGHRREGYLSLEVSALLQRRGCLGRDQTPATRYPGRRRCPCAAPTVPSLTEQTDLHTDCTSVYTMIVGAWTNALDLSSISFLTLLWLVALLNTLLIPHDSCLMECNLV